MFDKLYGEEAPSGAERVELEAELARIEAELARIADTMEAAAAEIERALSSSETDAAEPAGSAGLTPEEEAVARAAEMEELLARDDLADIPEAELAALLDELAGPYTPDVLVYSAPCAVGGAFAAGEGCHVIGHGHFYVDGDGTGVFTPTRTPSTKTSTARRPLPRRSTKRSTRSSTRRASPGQPDQETDSPPRKTTETARGL